MAQKTLASQTVATKRITQKYNLIASVYDVFAVIIESKARARALEISGIKNGERILEVAVGTGLNFQEILRRNPDGWNDGIDISHGMLRRAEKRAMRTGALNYTLQMGDCRSLPFGRNTFDLLVNEYMFDILPVTEYGGIIREFRRVLRPNGRLVLVNTTHPEKTRDRMLEWVFCVYPEAFSKCRGILAGPHLEKWRLREIRREYVVNMFFPSEVILSHK
jgi:ubiquinone/menaquinone biosynthesis C-methylase UbiE